MAVFKNNDFVTGLVEQANKPAKNRGNPDCPGIIFAQVNDCYSYNGVAGKTKGEIREKRQGEDKCWDGCWLGVYFCRDIYLRLSLKQSTAPLRL
ncbi:MAG: hypothetical protein R6U91_10050 [Bacillota bacterium]